MMLLISIVAVFCIISAHATKTGVSCGGHRAPSCKECPQGHGAGWCNGDCSWCVPANQCQAKGEKCGVFSDCGGTINGTDLNYPGTGSNYPNNKLCKWTIERNFTFVIEFFRFDLETSTDCKYDYLQVDNQEKLCGTEIPPPILIDKAHGTIDVTFNSDRSKSGKGFHMKIEVGASVDCGFTSKDSCKSIGDVLRNRASSYIKIKVLSNIVENTTITITRSRIITIEGVGNTKPVLKHVWSEKLFDISQAHYIKVQLTLINIKVIMREMNSLIRMPTYYVLAIHNFTLKMQQVVMERVGGMGNGRKVDYVIDGWSVHENIDIHNCNFSNFNSVTSNERSEWLLDVGVRIRGSTMITITRSSFNNNSFREGLIRVRGFQDYSFVNISMRNCIFQQNIGQLMYVDGFSESAEINYKHNTLTNNQVDDEQGLIWVRKYGHEQGRSKTWIVRVENMTAENNIGTVFLAQNYGKSKETEGINIEVDLSVFTKNTGFLRGGAIATDATSGSSTINLTITSSEFRENRANQGGAIWSNSYTLIRQSQFIMNRATIGGAILLSETGGVIKRTYTRNPLHTKLKINKMSDLTITTIKNALYSSTNLNIENVQILFLRQNHAKNPVEVLNHASSSQFLEVLGNISLICGVNQNVGSKKVRAKYEGWPLSYESAGQLSTYFTYLSFTCEPCPRESYSIKKGVATWSNTSILSTNKSTVENKCFSCPQGGNCSSGPIRSRSGYWGFQKHGSKEVEFVNCPDGYCSPSPKTFNSCAVNRHGILCGDCEPHMLLSVFSSDCLDGSICEPVSVLYMLGHFVCAVVILVLTVVFKEKIKSLVGLLVKLLKTSAKRNFQCCQTSKVKEQPQASKKETDEGMSTLKQLLLLFTFYQLYLVIYVPSKSVTAFHQFWNKIQRVLDTVFMMNFVGDGGSKNSLQYCLPAGFTYIHRLFLNIIMNVSPCAFCFILVIVISCCERLTSPKPELNVMIKAASFNLLNLFYIPLAKNLFNLLACVDIVHNDENVLVLYGQGSITCYQPWQYALIMFTCVHVLWYSAFLYVGTLNLQKQRYRQFKVMALVPITSPYFYWKLRSQVSSPPPPTSTRSKNISVESEQSNEQENVQTKDAFTIQCEKLVEVIQGPCRLMYWPSIVFLQKSVIVLMRVVFSVNRSQKFSLLVILFIYVILLVHKKPYKDGIMNMLEPTLMAMLLLLGVFGVVNQAYEASEDENIKSLLIKIEYLRFIILFLPVPMWILFKIIHKYLGKKKFEEKPGTEVPSFYSITGLAFGQTTPFFYSTDHSLQQEAEIECHKTMVSHPSSPYGMHPVMIHGTDIIISNNNTQDVIVDETHPTNVIASTHDLMDEIAQTSF